MKIHLGVLSIVCLNNISYLMESSPSADEDGGEGEITDGAL